MSVAEQLASLRSQFRDAQLAAERVGNSVDEQVWAQRPPGGGWSAAECIAHLTITTNAYLPLLAAARARAETTAALPARYRRGFLAALLEWSLEPPARMRTATLPAFVPGSAVSKAQTLADFGASQRALIALLDDVQRVPLHTMIMASPFNQKLRYNAYAAFRILVAHQRRHIWQAERATRRIP